METAPETVVAKVEANGRGKFEAWPILAAAVLIAAAILAAAWLITSERTQKFNPGQYQAVLLSNGQVYYGKLEGYGGSHPAMHEVYYVQTTVDQNTHQQSNILLKRGNEWHGPDRMWLNANQIILVEPVGPDSKVAGLIREFANNK